MSYGSENEGSRALLCQVPLSEHGEVDRVDGVRVWLPHECSRAGAIRREYATILCELLTHRSGLVDNLLIN